MVDDTDYLAIAPPTEKHPTEYTYTERRAEIARAIRQQGYPTGFNYAAIGRKYDVSREMIRRDFDRLKVYFRERIGDDAQTTSEVGYQKIIREHLDNGEYEKARRALDSWNGWLFDIGAQERTPDKLDVDQTTTHELGDEERSVALDVIRQLQERTSNE